MDHESPMPTLSAHNEVIARVMDDHKINRAEMARLTGCSASYIERVCSGQFAVPPIMTQTLWRLTSDQRIADVCLGEGSFQFVPVLDYDGASAPVMCARTVVQLASINNRLARGADVVAAHRESITTEINIAVRCLVGLKRSIASAPGRVLDRIA